MSEFYFLFDHDLNRKYEFIVPHYRSVVKFTLVDAVSEKKVTYSRIVLVFSVAIDWCCCHATVLYYSGFFERTLWSFVLARC